MGINLVARGDGIGPGLKASSVGLVLTDFAFGIWRDGIVITRDSVRDTVFNDYSLATVGLNIQGTHTYGLISTASAGSFGFGTQTPTAIVHIAGSRSLPYSAAGMVLPSARSPLRIPPAAVRRGAYNSSRFGPPTLAATNPVTYSDASTLTLGGCPVASTNVTITYCYGLKVGGDSFFQGEVVVLKAALSGTAPGASKLKLAVAAGTTAGTCKLVAYAGTSTTPTTIIDNVGAGC